MKKTKRKKRPTPADVTRYEMGGTTEKSAYRVDTGGGLRLVTKKEFNRLVPDRPRSAGGHSAERKLGGRSKNGHGVIPGAGHCWPLKCEALACHPSQVEGFRKAYKDRGVNVEVKRDGTVVVPDEGAYRRLRKVHGAHLRNSFNG